MKTFTAILASYAGFVHFCGVLYALPLDVTPLEAPEHFSQSNRLEWRGGFVLGAAEKRFGGISTIQINKSGTSLFALTDRGSWMRFTLKSNKGYLNQVQLENITPFALPKGEKRTNFKIDAEASVRYGNKTLLVAFERINRILAYDFSSFNFNGLPTAFPTPKSMKSLPRTGGIEAMTELCDGRIIAISEHGLYGEDARRGWILRNGKWSDFGYQPSDGYNPTGAALLPDCRIVVLERRFQLLSFSWRMAVLSPAKIQPGAIAHGEPLGTFTDPPLADNFEAIAVRRSSTGETLIYAMSDDNFSFLQQTLLLVFALKQKPQGPATRQ